MDDNIHPWAPGSYECTCGWSKCKGSVSRSTYYRHQVRHVLLQHYPRRQMPARMSVEDTFEVIKIACTKPKYVSFIALCILFACWYTICIHNMYTYLLFCTFELNWYPNSLQYLDQITFCVHFVYILCAFVCILCV
jgi:hypothetical protein